MPLKIIYRLILPQECSQVVALHRATFPSEQLARTIYESTFVDRYLASLVNYPDLQSQHILLGAWNGETLVGYAHFRSLPDSWHLNHIAVIPDYQGCGIGKNLWDRFIKMSVKQGYRQITLQVECSNRRALNWYRRQGLQIMKTIRIYEKDVSPTAARTDETVSVRLKDWEQSEAWQMAYGFSQFRLLYQESVWTIGRLGKQYFRVEKELPTLLESILFKIDPARSLLIFSSKPIPSRSLKDVGASFQMQGVNHDRFEIDVSDPNDSIFTQE